ncbi:cytoplasmic dynein 2 intermediate chain 2 [Sinocyclocheilus rhinocerous]|uniref:cytoplasmic dynein 2 intermediate chain 2 n=1 Tax=Sinocyclocheilus rhinocerous TaxID=307959 RepID=UPI0007B7B035|nr:PREDICTED: WD repeat-containing protein 34-like [Sinocyclocheilus rhinocerous]XP_016403713.1 PREDICTED: WD repeat-containing protein 34-like [Sinocyclocheilus rhinocerous]
MFTDETLDLIGAESTWRKSHQQTQESRSCQTLPVHTAEAETQAKDVLDNSTQTQDQISQTLSLDQNISHFPGLLDFLHKVEDIVIKELVKNSKSHAFDGFQVNWEDQNESARASNAKYINNCITTYLTTGDFFAQVSCMYRLQHVDAQERGLQVTSVSWNCTGSVIGCGFGRVDDGDWSNEKAYVCTWNLDRQNLNPKRPDVIIDVATPVMCLCFHPVRPSVVAGGLYSGEVVVWDTSRSQDLILAQTGMSADTHREPVFQVSWVPGARRGEFIVLSAGSGGRVLLWTVDGAEAKLILSSGYALVQQQVPQCGAASKTRGSTTIGVTSVALSPWDLDTFLVGSEGGLVLKCSFSSETVAAVPPDGESVTLRAPVQFSFSPLGGPVHSVHFSPFHRNLFVSVGTDGLAHVYTVLQPRPLLSLRVSDSYVFGVRWSPTRPLVFAAATGQGLVQMFDLGQRSLRPATTIDQNTSGQPTYCLEFNPKYTNLMAVGNADGSVSIWQLSAELTEQGAKETAMLEQLANEVAD